MRLISIGSARRVHLVDIQTVEGNLLYWSDAALANVPAVITADGNVAMVTYQPWILAAPKFSFHRSMQSDTGSFTVQNVSGDTLSRDFEKIVRRSAMEGALFVYRYWNPAAAYADREVHGTLTVSSIGTSTAELACAQLFSGQDDTPGAIFTESCQLVWAEKRCGATGTQECLYSFATCQVPEHYMGLMTTFETNFGEALPDMPAQPINRRRTI